jgi:hypothetical protein
VETCKDAAAWRTINWMTAAADMSCGSCLFCRLNIGPAKCRVYGTSVICKARAAPNLVQQCAGLVTACAANCAATACFLQGGECPRGETCTMTHSMFEYWVRAAAPQDSSAISQTTPVSASVSANAFKERVQYASVPACTVCRYAVWTGKATAAVSCLGCST